MSTRYLIPLLLLASACSQGPSDPDDINDIVVASERWASYDLDSYEIDQEVLCFCTPPHSFTIHVEEGTIVDIDVDESEIEGWNWPVDQLKEAGLEKAYTIDEVFALISDAMDDAAILQAEYDSTYGYPTTVYIDYDEGIADEEIRVNMSNLRF